MPIASTNNGLVTVVFERTAPNGMVFRDAIVISQAQYDALTQAQLDAMEQQRYDDWWAIVNAPPEEEPPVEEPVEEPVAEGEE